MGRAVYNGDGRDVPTRRSEVRPTLPLDVPGVELSNRTALTMQHLDHPVPLLSPQEGYDRAAAVYDGWHWAEFWRKNELPIVAEWIDALDPGFALDAGSGTGNYRFELEAKGHTCIPLDLSMEMLRVQRRKTSAPSNTTHDNLIRGNVRALPFSSAVFRYLICARVLSHVERLEPVLSEFARVVQPTGQLILSDVHSDHPYEHVTVSNGFMIAIQTYKHPVRELVNAITACRLFRILWLREYRLCDLPWKPPEFRFAKIYENPDVPIFYVCSLERLQA